MWRPPRRGTTDRKTGTHACAVRHGIRRRRRARAKIMESPWNPARQHGKHPGFAGSIILAFLSRCGEFV
jgi:hypothetical protein